jgi:hypothetical protein
MICNGRYWDQSKPNIPGMEKFKGVMVHSGDYRTFHPYVGKRVVVVGCSHSAGMYRNYFGCRQGHSQPQVSGEGLIAWPFRDMLPREIFFNV